jgi:hypothetical protein
LHVLDGNQTSQKYRDNVLAPRVVPHFDNHALADRPMFMDQLTVKGKTAPDSYTPTPKSSCAKNVVVLK